MSDLTDNMAMAFRAFISADIRPNKELIQILDQLAAARGDLKVVRPELMHLTLKFLGQTEEDAVEEISARMKEACSEIGPFKINLKGMGAFPSMSSIRVVWVGIENAGPLKQIAGRLDESMKDLGFERDKHGFKPHLTLARARSPRNIANIQEVLKTNAASDFGEYLVDRILLKRSVLSPSGPTYSVVREQALVG